MSAADKYVEEIREGLFALKDEKYKEFHKKLIPTVDENTVIGVRTPALRKYAKEVSGHRGRRFSCRRFRMSIMRRTTCTVF